MKQILFAVNVKGMLSVQCLATLQGATKAKHINKTAMATLLQLLGVFLAHKLQYLGDFHLISIWRCEGRLPSRCFCAP
jgi:hypothetical protein